MSKKGVKETIAEMTFKEKTEYLWTYYKWVLAVAAGVIVLIGMVVSCLHSKSVTTLYGGMVINVGLSTEGEACLSDDWFAHLGGVDKKEQVYLNTSYYTGDATGPNTEIDTATAVKVTAMVAAQELDYFIMDKYSYDHYKGVSLFAPLDEVLPQPILDELGDRIVCYTDAETGDTYPMALDITDTAFARDCVHSGEGVYLTFCGNTEHPTQDEEFLRYLLDWQPQ